MLFRSARGRQARNYYKKLKKLRNYKDLNGKMKTTNINSMILKTSSSSWFNRSCHRTSRSLGASTSSCRFCLLWYWLNGGCLRSNNFLDRCSRLNRTGHSLGASASSCRLCLLWSWLNGCCLRSDNFLDRSSRLRFCRFGC